jgi:GWxTD domain-containing protein
MLGFLVPLLLLASPEPVQEDAQKNDALEQQRQEEIEDYYEKWLKEDVVYIITDQELAVFEKLTTPEEKEQFIEQFWRRRDTDLETAYNEAKEEHYRRIAYANEQFTSGTPGWKTDRGMIYIIHGPPAEIENHAGGGHYIRPMDEGGGTTATYAFEKWRYRHIEGLGDDIELEFVDTTNTEEYRLAQTPFEKDMLLKFPGMGHTLAEDMGLVDRAHHPYLNPATSDYREGYPFMGGYYDRNPFLRYEQYARVQAAPALKYKELKELVDVNISFETLPVQLRLDYFDLNGQEFLVPITVEFPNHELSYVEADGIQTATIAIYGLITSIKGEVIQEFDDDVQSSFKVEHRESGLRRTSLYQKVAILDRSVRYKVDLVLKDQQSGKTGVIRQAIIPPRHQDDELWASSVILSNTVQSLPEIPDQDEMFILGDIRILPSATKRFYKHYPLNVYLQIYGAQLDQATFKPSLQVKYQVLKKGGSVSEFVDMGGQTIQYFSPRRVVLIAGIPIKDLEPGKYTVRVEVTDQISQKAVMSEDGFELEEVLQVAANR